MPYTPTPQDLIWAINVLGRFRQRKGVLVYPNTGLTFNVDTKAKTLTLVNSDSLWYFGITQQFIMSYYVFRAVGWDVKLPPTN